jgi:hypothetical protein
MKITINLLLKNRQILPWIFILAACTTSPKSEDPIDTAYSTSAPNSKLNDGDKWSGVTADVYTNGGCMTLWLYSNGNYTQHLFEQDLSVLPYHEQMNVNSYDLINCNVKGVPKTISHTSRGTYTQSGSTYYFNPRTPDEYIVAGEDDKGRKYLSLNGWENLEFFRSGDYQKVIYNRIAQNCLDCVNSEVERAEDQEFSKRKNLGTDIKDMSEITHAKDCVMVVYDIMENGELLSQRFPEQVDEIDFPEISEQNLLGTWEFNGFNVKTKKIEFQKNFKLSENGIVEGEGVTKGTWKNLGTTLEISINDITKISLQIHNNRCYGTGRNLAGDFILRGVRTE